MNCLNYNGNVGHILVKRHNKIKKTLSWGELPPDGLPRLVILQTRNEEGARAIIKKVSSVFVSNYNKTLKGFFLHKIYFLLPFLFLKLNKNTQSSK